MHQKLLSHLFFFCHTFTCERTRSNTFSPNRGELNTSCIEHEIQHTHVWQRYLAFHSYPPIILFSSTVRFEMVQKFFSDSQTFDLFSSFCLFLLFILVHIRPSPFDAIPFTLPLHLERVVFVRACVCVSLCQYRCSFRFI